MISHNDYYQTHYYVFELKEEVKMDDIIDEKKHEKETNELAVEMHKQLMPFFQDRSPMLIMDAIAVTHAITLKVLLYACDVPEIGHKGALDMNINTLTHAFEEIKIKDNPNELIKAERNVYE